MIKKKKILIATGGTGGHVFPAYSLASHLVKNNYDVKLATDNRGFNFIKDYKNIRTIRIFSSPLIKKKLLKFISLMTIIFFFNNKVFNFFIIQPACSCTWNGRLLIFSNVYCCSNFKN